jgi:hypothetical protein|tara:strand:- start:160 stop:666 length:507 start_codon:yes stop_codon:yes gene_type:complete
VIKIIDNLLSKKDLNIIQDFALTKAFYTPMFFENSPEKTKEYHYGNRFFLIKKPEILKLLKINCELKFNISIKKINPNSGIDQRNLDHFKPHIDTTAGIRNILFMISGPRAVTNGTVFYTEGKLDIHVGFKENRAVMFPSNMYHSQHASKLKNIRRYTSTLFIEDYEE